MFKDVSHCPLHSCSAPVCLPAIALDRKDASFVTRAVLVQCSLSILKLQYSEPNTLLMACPECWVESHTSWQICTCDTQIAKNFWRLDPLLGAKLSCPSGGQPCRRCSRVIAEETTWDLSNLSAGLGAGLATSTRRLSPYEPIALLRFG